MNCHEGNLIGVRTGNIRKLSANEAAYTINPPLVLSGIGTSPFGRIEAVFGMDCDQYYVEGRRGWVRLYEKGNMVVTIPCHHKFEKFRNEYVKEAGLSDLPKKVPLFQTTRGRSGKLTGRGMSAVDAWRMERKRAVAAGIVSRFGNHSFRSTGNTI